MALQQAAHEVDAREQRDPGRTAAAENPDQERILLHVTGSPGAAALIRRGRRVADYLRADCFAVAIVPAEPPPEEEREAMERHLEFARGLRIETRIVTRGKNEDEAAVLVDFARRNGVTQIFVNQPEKAGWGPWFFRRGVAAKVIRLARDLQVTVVADRRKRAGGGRH